MRNRTNKRKRLVTMPYILEELGISRSKFLSLVSEGEFPKPIKDSGGHTNLWLDSHSQDYIEKLVRSSKESTSKSRKEDASDE